MGRAVSGGNSGGLGRALGLLLGGIVVLIVLLALARGVATVVPQSQTLATETPEMECPTKAPDGTPVFLVNLSRSKYSQATQHIV